MSRNVYFWNNIQSSEYSYDLSGRNVFMSPAEVAKVAYDAGFRGHALLAMVALAGRESSYSPVVHASDRNQSAVSGDRGLWQINYIHDKTLADAGIISGTSSAAKQELFDPLTNARAAFLLSSSGTDFSAWNAGPGGYRSDGDPFYGTNLAKAWDTLFEAGYAAELEDLPRGSRPFRLPNLKTPNLFPEGTVFGLGQPQTQGELANVVDILNQMRKIGIETRVSGQFQTDRTEADDARPLGYSQPRQSGDETLRQIEGTEDDIRNVGEGGLPNQTPDFAIDDPAYWNGIDQRSVVIPRLDLGPIPRNWMEAAKELFPDYYWLIEQNEEIRDLMARAMRRGMEMSDDEFEAALRETEWYQNTAQNARNWDLLSGIDPAEAERRVNRTAAGLQQTALNLGLSFSMEELQNIALQANRNNWTDQEVQNYLGVKSIERFGVGELAKGYFAEQMRKDQKIYGVTLDDNTFNAYLKEVAVGTKNLNSFEDLLKGKAKKLYPTLSERLDAGDTFFEATEDYRTKAAELLEIDEAQIDMSDQNFRKALEYQPDATSEQRLMNNAEFERYLRTHKPFGYEFTQGARGRAAQVVSDLARSFGRI